jgi:hypothetical protein
MSTKTHKIRLVDPYAAFTLEFPLHHHLKRVVSEA